MRMYDIIIKKRNGSELSKEEIDFFIQGYTKGDIPDYQMSALLMAIYFKGMNKRETADLTMAMVDSGEKLDLSAINGVKVDKHSTGGVGDKTTLVLAPMVASAGVPVAKMSGRGLGHTGGTLDKLESFENLKVQLEMQDFINNVNKSQIAVCGQTSDLAPADKKLYALRDVTGTVDNLSLIASSIMSKKIASGADGIVLDVKTGSGAFMKDVDAAFELAKEMVDIGSNLNREVVALVTEMNEPLGYAVGNSLEVKEAIDTLMGKGPDDLLKLCLELGSNMLVIGGRANSVEEAKSILIDNIKSGASINKLAEMVKAQGGNSAQVFNPELLPKASQVIELKSQKTGYVSNINAEHIGIAALLLGAGRETKESTIDYSVGIVLNKKVGDYVNAGDILAYIHANDISRLEESKIRIQEAYTLMDIEPAVRPLIFGMVNNNQTIKY